jgi:hypothetical protein
MNRNEVTAADVVVISRGILGETVYSSEVSPPAVVSTNPELGIGDQIRRKVGWGRQQTLVWNNCTSDVLDLLGCSVMLLYITALGNLRENSLTEAIQSREATLIG